MRTHHHDRHDRDDRGVVALEMVLAMPFLLMLIVGVVVFGNALAVKTQTTSLASDGARRASLNLSLPANTVIVGAACPNPSNPATLTTVTVAATKPINVRSIPFLPAMLPASLTVTATMRCGG